MFEGEPFVLVEGAGEGVVFSTSQIFSDTSGEELIGTADCLSLEVSAAPIAGGFYFCNTVLNTVIPSTDGCLRVLCGRPTGEIGPFPTVTDALAVLRVALELAGCALSVCDLNLDGSITASDALTVLALAVGRAVAVPCLQ